MILKLIQSGGFLGRTKFAEEELSTFPKGIQDQINQLFSAVENKYDISSSVREPDQLQYFLEYNNCRLPISSTTISPELDALVHMLMQQLHY